MTDQQSWRLELGVHRGTSSSRDYHSTTSHFAEDKPLLSLEDCKKAAKDWEQNYHSLGLYIWYGNAIAPDGKSTPVLQGTSYR